MRRVLATDLGIWPMIVNQERASDIMISTPDYWSRVADYILLYDQIIIPTGNFQILPVLRLMLGEDIFDELIRSKAIILARYDWWFGYVGTGGVIFFQVSDNPKQQRPFPNLATMHFKPVEQAIEDALIVTNPPSSIERRSAMKNLLIDNVVLLPTENILNGVKEESYADIQQSPYLRDFLSLRNSGRSLDNLLGSKPDTVTIFNPHNPPQEKDIPEIRAVLRVVFENFLLSLGGHTQTTELTGDASTLTVLQAKGQRIGFSPEGRSAFAQLQKVAGIPDLGAAFASRQLSAAQIMDLRTSSHAQAFRDWLAEGSPSEKAETTVARYVASVGQPSLIERLPAKILRFATTTAWGSLEPISGAVAATVDNFLLSKWFPSRSPRLFMRQAKVVLDNTPVVRSPTMKGRDRNQPCSCASGKKYKHCCGR